MLIMLDLVGFEIDFGLLVDLLWFWFNVIFDWRLFDFVWKWQKKFLRIFSGSGVGLRRIWKWPLVVGEGEEKVEEEEVGVGGKKKVFCFFFSFIKCFYYFKY